MNYFALFTDGSLHPKLKIGFGGYLLLPLDYLNTAAHQIKRTFIENHLKLKKFTNTSSTKLELETIIWALEETQQNLSNYNPCKLTLFTDSQGVAGLLKRRERLEKTNFISKSSGLPLNHSALYRKFYKLYDSIGFDVVKVEGHSRSSTHDTKDRIFSYLDKFVRKKTREIQVNN